MLNSLTYAISTYREDRKHNEETKETEERKGKHKETMMFEDKEKQCLKVCTPKQ